VDLFGQDGAQAQALLNTIINLGFHKRRGTSVPAERLLASRKLCLVELRDSSDHSETCEVGGIFTNRQNLINNTRPSLFNLATYRVFSSI
jgi:hypothetical protein